MDAREQEERERHEVYGLRSALVAKDLELEILRHRLRLKDPSATVAPTIMRPNTDRSGAALAAAETENQELRGQVWELEQYVHILEGRLQKASGALLLAGGHQPTTPLPPPPPPRPPTRPPADPLTWSMDDEPVPITTTSETCLRAMTVVRDHQRQEAEGLRAQLQEREQEVADLQSQLSTVAAGLARVIARPHHLELEVVMEDLVALHGPLSQRGSGSRSPEPFGSDPSPAAPAPASRVSELEREVAGLRAQHQLAAAERHAAMEELREQRTLADDLRRRLEAAPSAEGPGAAAGLLAAAEAQVAEQQALVSALQERVGELLQRAQRAEVTVVEREEQLTMTRASMSATATRQRTVRRSGSATGSGSGSGLEVTPSADTWGAATAGGEEEEEEEAAEEEAAEEEEEEAAAGALQAQVEEQRERIVQLEGLLNAAPSPMELRALRQRADDREAATRRLEAEAEALRVRLHEAEAAAATHERESHELKRLLEEHRRAPPEPQPERGPCSCCALLQAELRAHREEAEAASADRRHDADRLTADLASRAFAIAELKAQHRRMEEDADAMRRRVEDLTAANAALTADLRAAAQRQPDPHPTGPLRAVPKEHTPEKRMGWRELVSSKHQAAARPLPTDPAADDVEPLPPPQRTGQGDGIAAVLLPVTPKRTERLSTDPVSPSPARVLLAAKGSPTARGALACRSPSGP